MSVLSFLGSGNAFKKKPRAKASAEVPSYQQFAGRHGIAFTGFRWARNIAIATTATSLVLAASTFYFANQQARVETAVVVLDPYGRIQDVIAATGFNPDERVKGHLIANYIKAARTISSDRVKLRDDLLLVESMTTQQGAAILADGYTGDPWGVPSMVPANKIRQVEGVKVFPPAGENSTYTAVWHETLWENGRAIDKLNMRGTVVLTKVHSKTQMNMDAVKRNPTGLWVDSFAWREEGE